MFQNTFLKTTDSPDACAEWMCERLVDDISRCIQASGRCIITLAGGSTPKLLYSKLADLPRGKIDWNKIVLLWGDERNVPPMHKDSNYLMVQQSLLARLPADQSPIVYRIPVGGQSIEAAATEYEQILKGLAGNDAPLCIDILLLGIGDDAHTASLFPHTAALQEEARLAIENQVEKLKTWRVTMTYRQLNAASHIYFLVCGESKAPALNQIWNHETNITTYPAQGIAPENGTVTWVVDQAAIRSVTSGRPPELKE